MQAIKQLALDTIRELPEDVDLDEIMYRLYVLDKVRKGAESRRSRANRCQRRA